MHQLIRNHQRFFATGFWIVYLGAQAWVGAASVIREYTRRGDPLVHWEPFAWEFTSVLCIGLLVPLVALFDRKFPINATRWSISMPAHLLATVPFSLLHVGGMVALRKLIYVLAGRTYDFGNIPSELLYEYRKDFLTYFFILAVIYLWHYYLHRLAPQESETDGHERRERFLVRKSNREVIINADEIDWVEASGNYAILHVNGDTYPVRMTMTAAERSLDPNRFARIHRSVIVNLDCIREIQPWFHGDHRIYLEDGTELNFSRRYRDRIKHLLTRRGGH